MASPGMRTEGPPAVPTLPASHTCPQHSSSHSAPVPTTPAGPAHPHTHFPLRGSSTRAPRPPAHLRGALHNGLALQGGHVVRNLAAVLAVVHHQQLQVLHVADHKLVEAWRGAAGAEEGFELHHTSGHGESMIPAPVRKAPCPVGGGACHLWLPPPATLPPLRRPPPPHSLAAIFACCLGFPHTPAACAPAALARCTSMPPPCCAPAAPQPPPHLLLHIFSTR